MKNNRFHQSEIQSFNEPESSKTLHCFQQDKVSIVIPCYKQAHYLGEAIESVLAQSYSNYEIIVIDDGSPDNTADVAARYRVGYVRQENQGLSGARNTGWQVSQGQYLVFLDADDRLTPDALRYGLNGFHAYPDCAFVSGHHRYIDGNGLVINEYPPEAIDDDYYLALLKRNYVGMHATVMYQRFVFDVVGGFDTALKACEDYDLYLRIAHKFPVYRHDQITAEYRWHDANMTHNSSRMLNAALTVLRSQWQHVQDNPHWVWAYGCGVRFWRNYFAQLLWNRIVQSLKSGRVQDAVVSMIQLLKYFPLWLSAVRLEIQTVVWRQPHRLKLQPANSAKKQQWHKPELHNAPD